MYISKCYILNIMVYISLSQKFQDVANHMLPPPWQSSQPGVISLFDVATFHVLRVIEILEQGDVWNNLDLKQPWRF